MSTSRTSWGGGVQVEELSHLNFDVPDRQALSGIFFSHLNFDVPDRDVGLLGGGGGYMHAYNLIVQS